MPAAIRLLRALSKICRHGAFLSPLLWCAAARAEPAEAPPAASDEAAPAAIRTERREVPDYDGLGDAPTTAGDVLLWVPRILVLPLYLTTEYLIRRPLGAAITAIEHNRVVQGALYFITFGGNKNIGLVPTFFGDFGALPSVGGYFFWDNALVSRNHVRVHAGTWGPKFISVSVTDRYDVGPDSTAALRGSWSRRADQLFYGLGPDSKSANVSRYSATSLDVGPAYDLRSSHHFTLATAVGVRRTSFDDTEQCCGDPSVRDRVGAGQLALPPRLADGYTLGYQSASIAFDTRNSRPAHQSGLRVVVDGQPAFDVSRRPGNAWVRYGATVGGFWDVTGKARVLSLTFAGLFADPLTGAGSDIPFTEQVSLGGSTFMRGFLPGRLVDRSAAVATLAYQWPAWVFLDGTMHVSTGNVFGPALRGFEPGKLRLSTGVGVRTNSSPDHQFELLVGFGTDTFADGAKLTSFRLALGATRGF